MSWCMGHMNGMNWLLWLPIDKLSRNMTIEDFALWPYAEFFSIFRFSAVRSLSAGRTGQVFTVGIMTLWESWLAGKTKQQQQQRRLTIDYNGIDGIIIWEQAVIRGLVMGEDDGCVGARKQHSIHCLGLGVFRGLRFFSG